MSQSDKFHEDYVHFTRDLAIWLISYGVGAPVLFLSNEGIYKKLASSNSVTCIIMLFFIGALLQVLAALISKWASWVIYSHVENQDYAAGEIPSNILLKLSDFWAERMLLPCLIDILSLVSFTIATILTFTTLI